MFIGREPEIQLLERLYRSRQSELFILYGRRRVGKTELLKQFCHRKPAVLYTASQAEPGDNLKQLQDICWSSLPEAKTDLTAPNLESLLTHLAAFSRKAARLIIVLDEFQYWVEADRSIPSQIQRFWDNVADISNIMLVLCGSYISLMIDQTLAEKSPLYGRRTAQLHLQPLQYREAAAFFPGWESKERLAVFGIIGGVPAYLRQFDPQKTLSENVVEKILSPGTFLSEEAAFLLKMELRETRTYTTLLKAIAHGNTKLKDISSKSGLGAAVLSPYLGTLQELRLVERAVSLDEPAPERSRKGRYFIQDPFLRFWFKFVEPHRTLIEMDQGERLFQEIVNPGMSEFLGASFENICRQYTARHGQEAGLPLVRRVGSIWRTDFDIDVAAENLDDSWTFAECKWSAKPIETTIAHRLRENASRLSGIGKKHHFLLFSLSGFDRKSSTPESTGLVSAQELLRTDRLPPRP